MAEIFQVTLIVATFLCTLVAGFVFAFAAVVMPGPSLATPDPGELDDQPVPSRVAQGIFVAPLGDEPVPGPFELQALDAIRVGVDDPVVPDVRSRALSCGEVP